MKVERKKAQLCGEGKEDKEETEIDIVTVTVVLR